MNPGVSGIGGKGGSSRVFKNFVIPIELSKSYANLSQRTTSVYSMTSTCTPPFRLVGCVSTCNANHFLYLLFVSSTRVPRRASPSSVNVVLSLSVPPQGTKPSSFTISLILQPAAHSLSILRLVGYLSVSVTKDLTLERLLIGPSTPSPSLRLHEIHL